MIQNLVINIGIGESLTIIFSGIALLITGSWYLSHRLTKVETKVEGFETSLSVLTGRLDNAFSSASPIKLLPKGESVLEDSGLKEYIDTNEKTLVEKCKGENQMANPYDIQVCAFKFFDKLELPELEEKMKTSAFKHGIQLTSVRRIGSIYFRDACLKAYNYKPEDLDKPKT